jgi:hypothetical protein
MLKFNKMLGPKKNPLLYVLIAMLLVISTTAIRPQFHFAGWDNYSSYLNLDTSIYRVIFSTWREHRGLGVASDSEVTDLPRVLFFSLARSIVPEQALDQLYYVLSLNAGVLGMYFLVRRMLKLRDTFTDEEERKTDLASFLGALFYLFNLNTLAVFYFPVFPYVARFFAFPILILAFVNIAQDRSPNLINLSLLTLATLLTAPSYIIGTVFITIALILLGVITFTRPRRKLMLVLVIFGLLNAFWLLPFANYTLQKSSIIPLAPTFVDVNETQLNKPKTYYNPEEQARLFPSFFETQITSIDKTESKYLHPLAGKINQVPYNVFTYWFPFLYILGAVALFSQARKRWPWLWAPSLTLLFLILSLKEFSRLGFLYAAINKVIPMVGILFRFGDTKLHPVIAFTG